MATFQFQGNETFNVARSQLWQLLTDPRSIPRFVPNLSSATYPDPDTLAARLSSSFSFAAGSIDLTVEFKERQPQQFARALITARGMGFGAVIDTSLRFTETGANFTTLDWNATAHLEGLLSLVSKGLIEGAAKKIISDSFEIVRREMSAQNSVGA